MDTQEEFAARAYAVLTTLRECKYFSAEVGATIDALLSQAPIETVHLGWAHIGAIMKEQPGLDFTDSGVVE